MLRNEPELWDKILAQMPKDSVIAGGAIRDYLLGVEPKDIDVFCPIYFPAGNAPAEEWALVPQERSGLERINDRYERLQEYEKFTDVVCVSRGKIEGYTVDLVELEKMESGEALVQTFDFDITRLWYDGKIHTTPEADAALASKTVTLLINERKERSLTRFERFNARMNGEYKLVCA